MASINCRINVMDSYTKIKKINMHMFVRISSMHLHYSILCLIYVDLYQKNPVNRITPRKCGHVGCKSCLQLLLNKLISLSSTNQLFVSYGEPGLHASYIKKYLKQFLKTIQSQLSKSPIDIYLVKAKLKLPKVILPPDDFCYKMKTVWYHNFLLLWSLVESMYF